MRHINTVHAIARARKLLATLLLAYAGHRGKVQLRPGSWNRSLQSALTVLGWRVFGHMVGTNPESRRVQLVFAPAHRFDLWTESTIWCA